MHNDKVGYVRSINPVAALLLVALEKNEEAAFWVLAALVEDILYQGTYSRNLEGCQVGPDTRSEGARERGRRAAARTTPHHALWYLLGACRWR